MGDLSEFVPGHVWTVDQIYRPPGGGVPVRMTLVRMSDGGLCVHSPLAIGPETRVEIDRLGPVRAIVAPSRFHYLDVNAFRVPYPEAVLFVSAGLKSKWATLRFTGVLDDRPPRAWSGELEQLVVRGHPVVDEVVFFHPPSRTLILTDLMMSAHADSHWSWRFVGKAVRIYENPAPPLEIRWTFTNRSAARGAIQKILEWDFDRILFAHGNTVPAGGKELFRTAFAFLLN